MASGASFEWQEFRRKIEALACGDAGNNTFKRLSQPRQFSLVNFEFQGFAPVSAKTVDPNAFGSPNALSSLPRNI